MAKKEDTGLGLWFEGMTPEQMHWHIVALQAGHHDRKNQKPKRPLEFWGIGQHWIDEVRERWGDFPDLEVRRRADILKQVARIQRSKTMDDRTRASRIGGLMASASRTPAEASDRNRVAQESRWLRKAREEFPEDDPEEQARKAEVLKDMQLVSMQIASLKARYRKKRGKTDEDTKRYKAQLARLRGRLGGLGAALKGDVKARTEKARDAGLHKLRQRALAENPVRTTEEVGERVAALRRDMMKRASNARRGRSAGTK